MRPLSDIKRMRMQLGLTQNQLAKQASVSQSLIAKIESGQLDPGYTKATHIFQVLVGIAEKDQPKAQDIMTRKIIWVKPSESALSTITLMRKNGISQVPVIAGEKVVGLVTEKNLLDIISSGKDLSKSVAEDVMDEAPPVVSPKVPVEVLFDLLKISPIAVIAEKGDFEGVVSRTDLLKTIVQKE